MTVAQPSPVTKMFSAEMHAGVGDSGCYGGVNCFPDTSGPAITTASATPLARSARPTADSTPKTRASSAPALTPFNKLGLMYLHYLVVLVVSVDEDMTKFHSVLKSSHDLLPAVASS